MQNQHRVGDIAQMARANTSVQRDTPEPGFTHAPPNARERDIRRVSRARAFQISRYLICKLTIVNLGLFDALVQCGEFGISDVILGRRTGLPYAAK